MSATTATTRDRDGPTILRCVRCHCSETDRRRITKFGRDDVEGVNIAVCGECMEVLGRETRIESATKFSEPRCGHPDCNLGADALRARGATLITLPGTYDGMVKRICSRCVSRGHVRLVDTRWVLPTAIGVLLFLGLIGWAGWRFGH